MSRIYRNLLPKILLIRCRRENSKFLYLIFCLVGGYYCSDIVSLRTRCIWLILNAISILYGVIIAIPSYLLTASHIETTHLLYGITISMCFLYAQVFIPSVTYYYHKEILNVINDLDDELTLREPKIRVEDRKRSTYDSFSRLLFWFCGSIALVIPIIFPSLVYTLMVCRKNCFRNQLIYNEATPFTDYINSLDVYLIVYIVETVHCLFGATQGLCVVSIGVIIGYKFHDVCVNLSIHIEHLIDDAVLNCNLLKSKSVAEQNKVRGQLTEDMECRLFYEFRMEFSVIVNTYQQLTG